LKGDLASVTHKGKVLPQWQYEVTGAGRIWYLVDEATRTLWLVAATSGHPKLTE